MFLTAVYRILCGPSSAIEEFLWGNRFYTLGTWECRKTAKKIVICLRSTWDLISITGSQKGYDLSGAVGRRRPAESLLHVLLKFIEGSEKSWRSLQQVFTSMTGVLFYSNVFTCVIPENGVAEKLGRSSSNFDSDLPSVLVSVRLRAAHHDALERQRVHVADNMPPLQETRVWTWTNGHGYGVCHPAACLRPAAKLQRPFPCCSKNCRLIREVREMHLLVF